MCLQTVSAAVYRRNNNPDHFFLCVSQIAGVVVEGSLEIQESDVLLCIQRKNLKEVVDEAPVFFHCLYIFVKYLILFVGHFASVWLLQAGQLFVKL